MRKTFLAAALALAACATSPPPEPGAMNADALDPAAFFDCVRERALTLVSAHRGGDAPAENALATFERTVGGAPGPVLLEVDVRRTRDGRLVLMHDETVDRTTNGTGRVADLTLDQFRDLKLEDVDGAATKLRPPTLRETLRWADRKAFLKLDIKRGLPFQEVVEEVRLAGAANRVVLISYRIEDVAELHRIAPEMMISAPVKSPADLDTLRAAGVNLSRILAFTGVTQPDAALFGELARAGVETIFGTLGDKPDSWDKRIMAQGDEGYRAIADMGVHVISTDRPLEAMRVIDDTDGPGAPAFACLAPARKGTTPP